MRKQKLLTIYFCIDGLIRNLLNRVQVVVETYKGNNIIVEVVVVKFIDFLFLFFNFLLISYLERYILLYLLF